MKPLSYYKYSTARVSITWNGKPHREMGIFKSAEEANRFLNQHATVNELQNCYRIHTPDGILNPEWI